MIWYAIDIDEEGRFSADELDLDTKDPIVALAAFVDIGELPFEKIIKGVEKEVSKSGKRTATAAGFLFEPKDEPNNPFFGDITAVATTKDELESIVARIAKRDIDFAEIEFISRDE